MAELFIFSGKGDLFSSQEITGILSRRSLQKEGQNFLSGPMHREACSMMKRQEQREVETTLAVVLLCARFYMLISLTNAQKGMALIFFFFFGWRWGSLILQRRKRKLREV